jgi:hypothetical protein
MYKEQENILDSVDAPTVQLRAHQKALRQSLLQQFEPSMVKGGEESFMKKKIFRVAALGFITLVLVGAFVITTVMPKTQQAQAQEIVDSAMSHASNLSVEDRHVIEQNIKSDLKSSLEEAKQASDLAVVPESEITRIDPPKMLDKENGKKEVFMINGQQKASPMSGVSKAGTPGKDGEVNIQNGPAIHIEPGKIMAPNGVKVLRYTNPQGQKIVLGINEQNEPVMKMGTVSEKDKNNLPQGKGKNVLFERAL